jgi:hypothetical protein
MMTETETAKSAKATKKTKMKGLSTTLAQTGLSVLGSGKRLELLLYGPPGTWKTVNAHQLPRTRTLDFDDGLQSVEWAILAGVLDKRFEDIVYRTILPPIKGGDKKNFVAQAGLDQVDEWLAEEDLPDDEWDQPYDKYWDTLIIDSASALTDASAVQGLRENDRLGLSHSWERVKDRGLRPMKVQDWGAASFLFMKFITYCRTIGKNLVVIAHERKTTDDEGSLIAIEPNVIGQLRESLPKDFDEVWYARIKGTKKQAKGIFQTKPDIHRRLRSRLGCLDADEDANFMAIKKKVSDFYKVPEELLWVAAHGSEEREALEAEEVEASALI